MCIRDSFNTAQYIIIANTNIDDRDMHRLGDHLGCVCTGDDNVIMFAVAFCKGKSLFHASCIGGKLDLRVLRCV